ncbi:MAG: hypothetical protein LBQ59_05805 [Candidatus Peribacteria bacterium]|jgi:uncharacterized membrane protein|nr:hypothetical protein [Candidatus Peribacteria bacterium]
MFIIQIHHTIRAIEPIAQSNNFICPTIWSICFKISSFVLTEKGVFEGEESQENLNK